MCDVKQVSGNGKPGPALGFFFLLCLLEVMVSLFFKEKEVRQVEADFNQATSLGTTDLQKFNAQKPVKA